MKPFLATLALAAVVLAWLLFAPPWGEAPPPVFGPGESVAPLEEAPGASLETPGVEESDRAPARDDRLSNRAPEPPWPEPTSTDVPDGPRRVLRGLLTDGEEGPPLPGIELAFRIARSAGGPLTSVVTDEQGRFESVPLPCGELTPRHVPELEVPERAVRFWVRPGVFTLPPSPRGEPEAPYEVTLWIDRPSDVLLVDVFEADGSPAIGARVNLRFTCFDPELGRRMKSGGLGRTNSSGRAHLGLWSSGEFQEGTLFARRADERVSEVVELDGTNYRGPHELVLGPAATLLVNVHWSFGQAAVGRQVQLQGPRDYVRFGELDRMRGVTDDKGLLWFRGLYPAAYTAYVPNPRTQGRERGTVTLVRGETRELEIELAQGRREVAARGLVVDEQGAPLAGVELAFRADEYWAEEVTTDELGAFECWAVPCDSVWIGVDPGPGGGLFEPPERTVLFGERNIVFRRVVRPEQRRFRLHAVDRVSGEEVEPLYPTFDRGPDSGEWSISYAPRETYSLEATSATRCKVASPGYVGTAFSLLEALASAQGDPPVIELELAPGLMHSLRVFDGDTRQPLAGVRFTALDLPAVLTDSDGWAHLSASSWSVYRVELEGYESVEWDPFDSILFDWGPLYLSKKP